MKKWTIKDAEELYNIKGWGLRFFGINEAGELEVYPLKDQGKPIVLKYLVEDLVSQGLSPPILLRFSDILRYRIEQLSSCFQIARKTFKYNGNYFGVYPVKVNQQRQVVEEILRFGKPFNIGLEVGSKSELLFALAMMNNPHAFTIINGYKDEAFIRLALIGLKLGRKIIIVVEKPSELDLIYDVSRQLQIDPLIGLRIRLSSDGSGRWASSSGEQSKFGLNSTELIDVVKRGKENNYLQHIQLIHFHLGSQITNIRHIKSGLTEIAHFYCQLNRLGCNLRYIDVGGGLGVDYDGSRTSYPSSVNYSMQEYANDVVWHIKEVCNSQDLPHPHLITESGRALVAHHSMLVFNVLDVSSHPYWDEGNAVGNDEHDIVKNLYSTLVELTNKNLREYWHDAVQLKEDVYQSFNLGLLDLESRAKAESIFWTIAKKVYSKTYDMKNIPSEMEMLNHYLADKYFCNFSLFQSLPDFWALDHLFPIIPIHRLHERPDREATLHDITCDSDGKIDRFIGRRDIQKILQVHSFDRKKKASPYYLGAFLTGAYQETLGDFHNLFGETNTAHISINEDGSYNIEQLLKGETAQDVLQYMQFPSGELTAKIEKEIKKREKEGIMKESEGEKILSLFKKGLQEYTYLSAPKRGRE
ncbi:MAG: biosynthetic arginine decarboxylase [bacterium]